MFKCPVAWDDNLEANICGVKDINGEHKDCKDCNIQD